MKNLRKKLAKIMAVLLVLGTFTPFPAVKAVGGISALASNSDAESALSDGKVTGEKLLFGEEPSGPEMTVYNNCKKTYTYEVSAYCPGTWSNAEYFISDRTKVSSKYILSGGYSIDQKTGELSVSVEQVKTSTTGNGIGTIIVVIANPSVRDASVSVAVNIKVTNPQIKLSFDNTGFLAGTAKNITVSKDPADYSAGLTWSSSDTSVATVNNGTVTGIKEGTATITCTDDIGLSSSVSVSVGETVIPTGIKIIAGTTVFIYSSNDHISSQFQYEITPSTFTGTVIWSSGDSGVATVDNNGLVTPVASGVTDITCTIAGYPNINDKIQVNVIATTVPADYEMGKQVINSAPSSTTSAGNILSNSEAVYTQTENTGAVSIVNSSSAAATLYSGSISEFLKNNGTDNSTMGDLIADDKNNEAVKVIPKNYGTGYDNSSAANSSANNTANDLTIHASTSLNDLKSVTMTAEATAQQINIDGQFDKMTGSTIINFHKDFLDTLQPGNYVVRLNYWDKYIDTEITINGAPLHFADGSVNSSYRAEAMETGGHFTGSGDFWSFVKSDGAWTSNEWICYNGRPYYIGKGGLMRSGLIMDTSGAVYLLSSLHDGHYGAAVSGWVKDADGNIYFFDPETYKMVTGEKMIDHTTCTFADDGHMIS